MTGANRKHQPPPKRVQSAGLADDAAIHRTLLAPLIYLLSFLGTSYRSSEWSQLSSGDLPFCIQIDGALNRQTDQRWHLE